jgi:sugar/nucleoside kinase (ribokinase family)
VRDAAKWLFDTYSPEIVVITRGKLGGVMYDGREFFEYPAYTVNAIDTNGSGDVFHGAFAAGIVKGYDYRKCCYFSSATSAVKCMGVGARESVPSFDTLKKFMKENGYEL